jgi:predicted nucleotidyltransferase
MKRRSSIRPARYTPGRKRTPKRTDPLSTTLASSALARLVIDLAVRPDEAPHGRALQRRTGLTPRSLQTELRRLEGLGVLRRRPEGRRVRYVLDEGSSRWRALRELVRELADPVDVLRDALAEVPGIAAAFVFGSTARGDARADSDLDVMIVDEGEPLEDDLLARRTLGAGVLLRREVNVVRMSRDELASRIEAGGGFVREVLRGPKLWIVGSESDLGLSSDTAWGKGT